jgi:hypothetical protein
MRRHYRKKNLKASFFPNRHEKRARYLACDVQYRGDEVAFDVRVALMKRYAVERGAISSVNIGECLA